MREECYSALGTLLRLRGRSKKLIASMFDFSTKADRKEAGDFLDTVWQGLEYLCEQVERVERERAKPDKNFAYVDFGSSPGDAMVCNYFLWYASALYNFVGVFEKAFSPSQDLQDEFKEVIKWRHKVAAHTAWVWPRHDDNAPTQDMSILLFPEFNFKFDGHFEVGGFRVFSEEKGESSPRVAVGTRSHASAAERDREQIRGRQMRDKCGP